MFSEPPAHPEKQTEKQLSALTAGMLIQHQRVVMDSVGLAQNTRNAETRYSRIELCYKPYQKMLKLKTFCDKEQLDMIKDVEDTMRNACLPKKVKLMK